MKSLFFTFFLIVSLACLSSQASAQKFKPGQRVEVNYNGHWYKSTILQVSGDKYKVHYDGYPASDDAWMLASYIRTLDVDGNPVSVVCAFEAPPGSFTNRSTASTALFKRELYEWYQQLVTGSVSSPKAIGIVFKTFSQGRSYVNTVGQVAGRGAMRKHSGAPANAIIYPVKASYFVCESYSTGVSQKEVNADFSFFKNKDGEWTCSKDN